MNKKGQGLGMMGKIIGMFILAIFGIVLTVATADIIFDRTNSIDVTNETLSVTNLINNTDVNTSRIFNLTNAPWESGTVLMAAANGTPLTAGTDFNVDISAAAINFSNTSAVYGMAFDIVNESLNVSILINATDVNTSRIFNLTNNIWKVDTVLLQMANGTPLTAGTDFDVDYDTEAINFSNTSAVYGMANENSNITGVNYSYFSDNTGVNYSYFSTNFINDGISRIFINLIVLFFVIGLILMILARLKGFEIMDLGKR